MATLAGMNQEQLKRAAAEAALKYVVEGELLGVGTGSTVNHFIELLGERGLDIPGAVSSSEASTERRSAFRSSTSTRPAR